MWVPLVTPLLAQARSPPPLLGARSLAAVGLCDVGAPFLPEHLSRARERATEGGPFLPWPRLFSGSRQTRTPVLPWSSPSLSLLRLWGGSTIGKVTGCRRSARGPPGAPGGSLLSRSFLPRGSRAHTLPLCSPSPSSSDWIHHRLTFSIMCYNVFFFKPNLPSQIAVSII